MIEKAKQYRNLILVAALAVFFIALLASDPLGFCTKRAHDRAAVRNQMAIEKAEADQQIAIIKAQTDAELKRIERGEAEKINVTEVLAGLDAVQPLEDES